MHKIPDNPHAISAEEYTDRIMSKPNENIIDLINGTSTSLPLQPAKAAAAMGSKEHRSVPRFYVKWRAVAFIDAQSQYHGFIKDISTKGAAIFLDRNLQSLEFIKLHIQVPPSNTLREPRILKVYGKIAYTTHDRSELLFRTGISFLKFDSEHDPGFLETFLADNHTRII